MCRNFREILELLKRQKKFSTFKMKFRKKGLVGKKKYLKKVPPCLYSCFRSITENKSEKSKCLRRYLNNICSLFKSSFIELNRKLNLSFSNNKEKVNYK